MQYVRKLGILCITAITLLTLSFSSLAATDQPYNNMVFFGDSITDNGNLYRFSLGIIPKSPPYMQGRFSNGYTWAEKVADYFSKTAQITSANYGVGGSTTILHSPLEGYLPYALTAAVDDYFFRNAFYDKSHTLFTIWIGANDYLPQKTYSADMVKTIIATQKGVIERFIQSGAKNFLIVNLPDLAKTPRISGGGTVDIMQQYTIAHNTQLAEMVESLKTANPAVRIALYDVNQVFGLLIDDPEIFNQKYNVHITDTKTACWNGGYTLKTALLEKNIEADLNRAALLHPTHQTLDTHAFAHYIAENPDLAETYAVGKSFENGATVCANPNEHLFWDNIHPTEVTHTILSLAFIQFIQENLPNA